MKNMIFYGAVTVFVAACQPHGGVDSKVINPESAALKNDASSSFSIVIDNSTPDRALKSYWQSNDALRKIAYDLYVESQTTKKVNDLRIKVGYEPQKLQTDDVLESTKVREKGGLRVGVTPYSREILDVKQDTESHATAVVQIRNVTPVANASELTEAHKKRREEGEKFKYILSKEVDGWKVSQMYSFDSYEKSWKKVYSPDTFKTGNDIYVNQYEN